MHTTSGSYLRFSGDRYTLTFPADRDFVYLEDVHGALVAELFVLSGIQPINGCDDTTSVGRWQVEDRPGETVFTLRARSSLTLQDDPAAGRNIGEIIASRAAVARAGCPEALIDTDNWPVRDQAAWQEYLRLQPSVGVPSLYFILNIDVTQQLLDDDDYQLIKRTWDCTTSG